MICDITDLPEEQCAHCHPPEKETWEAVTYFDAMYSSMGDCGHRIEAGDPVAYSINNELLCPKCAVR